LRMQQTIGAKQHDSGVRAAAKLVKGHQEA
jgi:hypothetical protein